MYVVDVKVTMKNGTIKTFVITDKNGRAIPERNIYSIKIDDSHLYLIPFESIDIIEINTHFSNDIQPDIKNMNKLVEPIEIISPYTRTVGIVGKQPDEQVESNVKIKGLSNIEIME